MNSEMPAFDSVADTKKAMHVLNINADEAWQMLQTNRRAILIDVRTHAEWTFVGTTDLSSVHRAALYIEWEYYPHMERNRHFVNDVFSAFDTHTLYPTDILFLCRSGTRSSAAAVAISNELYTQGKTKPQCYNISDGFEGPLDITHKRNKANGWRARGLPWKQS